jgi:DNA gyrase inhibitor GyrI
MKSRKRIIILLSAILLVELTVTAGLCITRNDKPYMPEVKLRQIGPQTVLYTIHRGPYENIGETINQLHELAVEKNIYPIGPVMSGYLNDPTSESMEHWLIEVRIPVDDSALSLAGTLGDMVDVKSVPAMQVVVATKPQGQSQPGYAIESLYSWINRNGYFAVDRIWQSVIENKTGDYKKMKTEFIIPIEKIANRRTSVIKCGRM